MAAGPTLPRLLLDSTMIDVSLLTYGFGGAGVLEVVEDHDGDTYRAVYTVRFSEVVYVLHAFQKKSKHGIATPPQEMDKIRTRLKRAEEEYQEWKKRNL